MRRLTPKKLSVIGLLVAALFSVAISLNRSAPTPLDREREPMRVTRLALQTAAADLSHTLSSTRAVPESRGGTVWGLRLVDVQPGCIWTEFGLNSGDVITGVDGEPFAGPLQVMSLIRRAIDNGRVDISIERNGAPQTVTVVVFD